MEFYESILKHFFKLASFDINKKKIISIEYTQFGFNLLRRIKKHTLCLRIDTSDVLDFSKPTDAKGTTTSIFIDDMMRFALASFTLFLKLKLNRTA